MDSARAKKLLFLSVIGIIILTAGIVTAKPGNGNGKSGYVAGGYGMVNSTRLNWSIPDYDVANFSYRAEIWNNDFTELILSINVPSQAGAVIFNPNILPDYPVWLLLIGRNRNPDAWCDNSSYWYHVTEINEYHCTPDQVVDLYYFNKNNFDPLPDEIFIKRHTVYKYQSEKPKGSGFLYQDGKI